MIRTVARVTLLQASRDGRVRWAALAVWVLFGTGLASAWDASSRTRDAHAAAEAASRHQWEGQEAKNPHSAAHFGTYAFHPPMLLAYVDPGIDQYSGQAIWIEAHKQNLPLFRPAEDRASMSRFGDADVARVMQEVVPLLIVVLGFGAVAREKEDGILRQALGMGVPGRTLIAGKILGLCAVIAVVVLPALLAALVMIARLPAAATPDIWLRGGLLLAVYVSYWTSLVVMAVLVSVRVSTARAALLVLLTAWMLACVVIPRAAADVASRLYPAPDTATFLADVQRDLDQGIDGHDPSAARTEQLRAQVLAQYGVTRAEDLPVNFTGIALQAGEEYGNRVFDSHYGRLWAQLERQNCVMAVAGVLSPLLAVRPLSAALAGTDERHHRHFASAAEAYRRALNKSMNNTLAFRTQAANGYKADPALWRDTPAFAYVPPRLNDVSGGLVVPSAVLLTWVLGMLAWLSRSGVHQSL